MKKRKIVCFVFGLIFLIGGIASFCVGLSFFAGECKVRGMFLAIIGAVMLNMPKILGWSGVKE